MFEELKKADKPLTVVGDGTQRRDFTHVDDIVSGLIKLANREWQCEIVSLGTGKNYSILDLVQMFEAEKIHLPARPGEAKKTLANVSETKKILDWSSTISLEDYIKNWMKQNVE